MDRRKLPFYQPAHPNNQRSRGCSANYAAEVAKRTGEGLLDPTLIFNGSHCSSSKG